MWGLGLAWGLGLGLRNRSDMLRWAVLAMRPLLLTATSAPPGFPPPDQGWQRQSTSEVGCRIYGLFVLGIRLWGLVGVCRGCGGERGICSEDYVSKS